MEGERERTVKVTQKELKESLQVQSAQHVFDLQLEHGPYKARYSRNGKFLLLAGRKGHLAMVDWKEKAPVCEFSAKERIRDACFLQNHNMFAVAQKKTVNIYDQNGIELHCLKDHPDPHFLSFLPYHFLLATITAYG